MCNGAGIISTKFMKERPATAEKVLKVMHRAISEYNKQKRPKLLEKYLSLELQVAEAIPYPPEEFIFYVDLDKKHTQAAQNLLDLFYQEKAMPNKVNVEDLLASS